MDDIPGGLPGTESFALVSGRREGYDQGDVDAFVAKVRAALRHDPPAMAPYEVADQRFRTVRAHGAYDMKDVDDFLDRAEQVLRERHGGDVVADLSGRKHVESTGQVWQVYAVAALAAAVLVAAVVVVVLKVL